MDQKKPRRPLLADLSLREKSLLCVIAGLLAALIAITCISINIRVNMQNEYAAVRSRVAEALYSNMTMLTQTFDMTSVPNADVKNAVIPQMKNYFVTAVAMNDLIGDAFGTRYQVLSTSDISAIRTAFSNYDAAFRSDAPTDLAQADMQDCIARVRSLLNSRFSDGVLRMSR